MTKIVKATLEHSAELGSLLDEYRSFYKQASDMVAARTFIEERISKKESIIFLAFVGEVAVGFTQLYTSFSSVSLRPLFILNDLFVQKKHRSKGIGEALLIKAKQLCGEVGYKGLMLETATDNPAQGLYEKLGWKKDTDTIHYFWTSD